MYFINPKLQTRKIMPQSLLILRNLIVNGDIIDPEIGGKYEHTIRLYWLSLLGG